MFVEEKNLYSRLTQKAVQDLRGLFLPNKAEDAALLT
jgi:hypothetical protein